ncbi:imidazole glycerol phosphate synthase subunit HisH [Methanorbis furvi]|uniref:Imidazole glycerol phosphate synthase subunit HisH n=1 Tax=Methanorbis furvi TaxID=3028299 RepID=A0AAE4ME86_9EURY|nr:Imidazole glycerol phosphate synthase subunit HisH [Methanocorpusculaceae archaeon Ag1]
MTATSKIAVIDYGLGNLRSVVRGLEAAGCRPVITAEPELIASADGIVLPGVGAFAEGMEKLAPIRHVVEAAVLEKPLLGICLGMQMLLEESEEHGLHQGLGFVPGSVRKFAKVERMKVPQMGWNTITPTTHPLFADIPEGTYVYFVHSYYADTTPEFTIATTEYIVSYASAVANKNAIGVQFHPEKSGPAGLAILRNFVAMTE